MEDFSQFITEEIFIIDESRTTEKSVEPKEVKQSSENPQTETSPIVEEPVEETVATPSYKIGVVTGDMSKDDQELLGKILGAIGATKSEANLTAKVDASAGRWLVFDAAVESIDFKSKGDQKIISCRPLKELQQNVEHKKELWGLLKNHFDI